MACLKFWSTVRLNNAYPVVEQLTNQGLINRCGLAMLHKLAGGNPVQVIASHEPGIEPCRHIGNDVLDA